MMFDADGMKKIVAGAVVAALADQAPALLTELVNKTLEQKVDTNGQAPRYPQASDMTTLEWFAQGKMKQIIREATEEAFASRADEIREAVKARIQTSGVVDALVSQLERKMTEGYMNVAISFDRE